MAIMGELERGNLINSSVRRIDYPTLHEAFLNGIFMEEKPLPEAFDIFRSAPAMERNLEMGSQNTSLQGT